MSSISCSPTSGRSASVGGLSSPGLDQVDVGLLGGDDRGALRPPVNLRGRSGSTVAPSLSSACRRTTCSRRGCMVRAAVESTPDAVGREAPRDPCRLGLELGHQWPTVQTRLPGSASRRSLGESPDRRVSSHAGDACRVSLAIVRTMPQRHKEAPPEEELYAPVAWSPAGGEFEDIRHEKAEGIAKITIDTVEVLNAFRPQTWVGKVSAALERAREDTEVGLIVLTGECEGVPARAATSGSGRHARSLRPNCSVSDLQARRAACRSHRRHGGRLRRRRRPRPPRLRPDDRRRHAVFGQTGPRVGSWGRRLRRLPPSRSLARTRRPRKGCCAASTTPRRPSRWAWSNWRRAGGGALSVSNGRLVRRDARPLPLRPAPGQGELQRPHGYVGIQQLAHDANLLITAARRLAEGREAFKEKRQPEFRSSRDGHEGDGAGAGGFA